MVLPSPFHSSLSGRRSWLGKWWISLANIIWLGIVANCSSLWLRLVILKLVYPSTLKYRKNKCRCLILISTHSGSLDEGCSLKCRFSKSSLSDFPVQPKAMNHDLDFSPYSLSIFQGAGPSPREWESREVELRVNTDYYLLDGLY